MDKKDSNTVSETGSTPSDKNNPDRFSHPLEGIPNFYQQPFRSGPEDDCADRPVRNIDLDNRRYRFNDRAKAKKRIGSIIKILSRIAFYEESYNLLVEYKLALEALEDLDNFIEPVNEQEFVAETTRKKQISRYEMIEKAIKALEERTKDLKD